MRDRYILAIDQGTSATKTVIFDSGGQIAARASSALASSFPRPGGTGTASPWRPQLCGNARDQSISATDCAPRASAAMIGDSHAAAFGEQCFAPGTAKATLGTGSSIMMNVGQQRRAAQGAMVSTICFSMKDRVDYALEGIVVSCGATIAWLRDQVGVLAESRDSESMAREVPDNGGVYLVPAFSGLGAPWWRMDLRAAILGLTFGSTKNHIVRSALESIPYQIAEVITAMEADSSVRLTELRADGGITENDFVMQFLADLLSADVVSNGVEDVSALGAAALAGLEVGLYPDLDALAGFKRTPRRFTAGLQSADAKKCQREWKKAVTKLL